MATNGTATYRPTDYVPSSPATNNLIYFRYTDGTQDADVMTIYEYRKLRQKLLWFGNSNIAFMGLVKPRDENEYLKINPNDEGLKRYLQNKNV